MKTEYVGNGSKGFWSDSSAQIPPKNDDWCEKPPVDHMVRRGSYYYATRTSYPYEDYDAFTEYAVRVHVETGDVIPYE